LPRSSWRIGASHQLIRLLIVDDRPVFREGVKHVISQCRDMRLVEASVGRGGVLDAAWITQADVLLLGDVSLPPPKILDLIRRHTRRGAKPAVLVLGVRDEEEYVIRVLRAGAAGYLTKDHLPRQLVEAIRRVAGGRRYLSPGLAQRLVFDLEVSEKLRPHEGLSDREYEVLCMFCTGRPFKEIAEELGVSPKTVSTYRNRILQKLHLKSNAQIIRYGIENGMVT
jgi:two-component system invasion response regulator UvrY